MFWENVPYWISLRRMEGLRRVEISQHLDLEVSWICGVIPSSLLMVMHLQVHHSSLNCCWLRKSKSYLFSEASSFSICIPLIFKELSGSLFDFQDNCNKMRKTWSLYRTEMYIFARLQQRIPPCSLQLILVASSPNTPVAESLWFVLPSSYVSSLCISCHAFMHVHMCVWMFMCMCAFVCICTCVSLHVEARG